MDNYIVLNDSRKIFKKTTFSNYKKTDVIKKLTQSMYYQKLEESFFWTYELLSSNMILELWNLYFIFLSKYIHIYNPKLPIYINKKFKDFREIAEFEEDLNLRNNKNIRNIFGSITLILCYSDKYSILDDLNYKFNFQIENLYENLKADNIEYINYIYKQDDPKEYIIPFNELIYHLQKTKNKIDINFWINWIIQYDILCNKKKKYILGKQRDFYTNNNERNSKNIIWIIWDIIIKMSKEKKSDIKDIIHNLFELFIIKYTISYNKKRIHLIYHCIEILLLDKKIDFSVPILKQRDDLKNLEQNINTIFEQIKKHEIVETNENISSKDRKLNAYKDIYNNL